MGESQHWQNWRARVQVVAVGNVTAVISEATGRDDRIWGLIDRDWRGDQEITDLEKTNSRLLVLPRITIENYCIDPDELVRLLPAAKRPPNLRADIEQQRDTWVQNGAMWQTLYEHGALEFCRGHDEGYPMALLHQPIVNEGDIQAQFQRWYDKLEPTITLQNYRLRVKEFLADKGRNYARHIHGKNFFNQVVVPALNRHLGQRDRDKWLQDLFSSSADIPCPPDDIVPVLKNILL